MRPATQRSRVDLPEPDLPSRATISPSERVKLTPSRTGRARPSGVLNVLVTDSAVMITAPALVMTERFSFWWWWLVLIFPGGQDERGSASQRVPPVSERIQAAPQQPVGKDYVHAHYRDAHE